MKAVSIANKVLLLVVVLPCVSPTTLGECKLICKQIRTDVLAVKGHCMPAMKQSPTPDLFNACVEGRKKAFHQACIPICTKSEVPVTSFQGCQDSVKNKGHKFVSWCRKVSSFPGVTLNDVSSPIFTHIPSFVHFIKTQGYDSILQNLDTALVERLENVKQDEIEQKSDEGVEVQNERELIESEPVATEESEVSESESIDEEYVYVGPTQIEDEPMEAVDEAKGGLRGAIDEPDGSESVNDDIVLFEHETHEEEYITVVRMENEGDSLENNKSNDETAFEL